MCRRRVLCTRALALSQLANPCPFRPVAGALCFGHAVHRMPQQPNFFSLFSTLLHPFLPPPSSSISSSPRLPLSTSRSQCHPHSRLRSPCDSCDIPLAAAALNLPLIRPLIRPSFDAFAAARSPQPCLNRTPPTTRTSPAASPRLNSSRAAMPGHRHCRRLVPRQFVSQKFSSPVVRVAEPPLREPRSREHEARRTNAQCPRCPPATRVIQAALFPPSFLSLLPCSRGAGCR